MDGGWVLPPIPFTIWYVLWIKSMFPAGVGGGEGLGPDKSLPWCTWSWPAAHPA